MVGSENGSTFRFANSIQKQLIDHGQKVFVSELNKFSAYPKAEHIIVFTSTHGLGDAPSNGTQFKTLLEKQNQDPLGMLLLNYVIYGNLAINQYLI